MDWSDHTHLQYLVVQPHLQNQPTSWQIVHNVSVLHFTSVLMRTVWVCAARLLLRTQLQQSQQHSSSVSGQGNDWWTHTSGTFLLTFLPIGDIQLEVCAFSQAYRCTQLEKWLLLTILLINPMIRSKTQNILFCVCVVHYTVATKLFGGYC